MSLPPRLPQPKEPFCQHPSRPAAETGNLFRPQTGLALPLTCRGFARRRRNPAAKNKQALSGVRSTSATRKTEQVGCMWPAQLGEGTTEKWPLSKPSERNPSDLPLISGGKIFVHLDARGLLLDPIFWKTLVSSRALKSLRTRYLPRLRCR